MKMKWQTPPEPRRGRRPDTRTNDEKFADELRKHPGDWAVWREGVNSSLAFQVKSGKVSAFRPAGAFEAVSRALENNRGTIYVRFVGGQEQQA